MPTRYLGEYRNDSGASQVRLVNRAVHLVLAAAGAVALNVGLDQGNKVREASAGASTDVLGVFTDK